MKVSFITIYCYFHTEITTVPNVMYIKQIYPSFVHN